MTVVMAYPRRRQLEMGEPPPDTMSQRIHDQAQNLASDLRDGGGKKLGQFGGIICGDSGVTGRIFRHRSNSNS